MRIEISHDELELVKRWVKLVRKVSTRPMKHSPALNIIFKNGFGYRDFKEAERLSKKSSTHYELNEAERHQIHKCLEQSFAMNPQQAADALSKLTLPSRPILLIDEAHFFYSNLDSELKYEDLEFYRQKGFKPRRWEMFEIDGEFMVLTLSGYKESRANIKVEDSADEILIELLKHTVSLREAINDASLLKHNPLRLCISETHLLLETANLTITPIATSTSSCQDLLFNLLTKNSNVDCDGSQVMKYLSGTIQIDTHFNDFSLVSTELYFKFASEFSSFIESKPVSSKTFEINHPNRLLKQAFSEIKNVSLSFKESDFDSQIRDAIESADDSQWAVVYDFLSNRAVDEDYDSDVDCCHTPKLFERFPKQKVLQWAGEYFDCYEMNYEVNDLQLMDFLLMSHSNEHRDLEDYDNCSALGATLHYGSVDKGLSFAKLFERLSHRLGSEASQCHFLVNSFERLQEQLSSPSYCSLGQEYTSFHDSFRSFRKQSTTYHQSLTDFERV